jgi:serine/threonine-protein kinase RsbW
MQESFIANIDQLHDMLAWIRKQVAKMKFDRSRLHQIELASEEVLVNIIHHGYQGRQERIEIQVDAFPDSHIQIEIKDSGPPFNPMEENLADLTSDLDDREVGGLGIHFIRKLMDEVRYKREGNLNVLVLVKKV